MSHNSDGTKYVNMINSPAMDLNNNSSKTQNVVNVPTTANQKPNDSVMTMPVAMQLPGLTAMPFTLCALNGNPGLGTASGFHPNVVNQPFNLQSSGIFVVNVAGGGNASLPYSQLACGQLQQQTQPQVQQPVVNPLIISSNNLAFQQQAHTALQPTTTVINQQQHAPPEGSVNPIIQVPGNISQPSPAAYMLVPLQQVPISTGANTQPANSQTQVSQGVTSILQQKANLMPNTQQSPGVIGQSIPSFPQTQHNSFPVMSAQRMVEVKTVSSVRGALTATQYQPGNVLPTGQQLQQQQQQVVVSGVPTSGHQFFNFPGQPVSAYPPNPIHDPHISSTIQVETPPVASPTSSVAMTPTSSLSPQVRNSKMDAPPQPNATGDSPPVFSPLAPAATEAGCSFEKLTTYAPTSINAINPSQLPAENEKPREHQHTETVWNMGLSDCLSAGTSEEKVKVREKRKKGPAPKLDGNEVCLICTDKASGYHYGVLTCEGCKGFFRRSVIKASNYKCKNDGKCQMDTYMRRKCQRCRLDKCRAAGMKDESVLSEAKAKKIKREKEPATVYMNLSVDGEPIPTLTSQQRNLVEMLQANESRFQWPTKENVAKVTPWDETGESHKSRASRFAHFTELAILIVQLVVEFTKQLPGFMSVSREDQIVLLKACTIEVMLLRAAKQFDKKSKAINFLNGQFYNRDSFYKAGIQVEFVDPIFDFCRSMAKLGLDEAEYALLAAINTFSTDRPNIKDMKKVEALQDSYVELLRVYLKIHHPTDPLMFPRTLMKLVELRSLNNYHSEQIFALKVQDKQLPPLLAEIWDM